MMDRNHRVMRWRRRSEVWWRAMIHSVWHMFITWRRSSISSLTWSVITSEVPARLNAWRLAVGTTTLRWSMTSITTQMILSNRCSMTLPSRGTLMSRSSVSTDARVQNKIRRSWDRQSCSWVLTRPRQSSSSRTPLTGQPRQMAPILTHSVPMVRGRAKPLLKWSAKSSSHKIQLCLSFVSRKTLIHKRF